MNEYVVLVDYDGEEYEVDAADCEEAVHDGELGVWVCFEADGEDQFFPYDEDEEEEDEEDDEDEE